ncbi:hypothetical protein DFR74_10471 [Nocardia puris]|uniref:Uncharacterized protein n=1 Tax=Nocardia puris TaxID=208602 RepID=A0A366DPI5_9NOCA|nr:hypothetical protein DFR74_10471 [Nocardia puris]
MPADPREYITIALDFPDHPKFAAWSDSARFKLIRLWTYCARHHTDGFVPTSILHQICRKNVVDLLRATDGVVFLEDGTGLVFTDYTQHQRSRAEVAASRDRARSAGVRSGESRRRRTRERPKVAAPDTLVGRRTEEEQEEDYESYPPNPPAAEDISFERWWDCYPRKVGKPAARKAFHAAVRKVESGELLARTEQFASDPNLPTGADARFIPHPATWLNQERWNDPPQPARHRTAGAKSAGERASAAIRIGEDLRRAIPSEPQAAELPPPLELSA